MLEKIKRLNSLDNERLYATIYTYNFLSLIGQVSSNLGLSAVYMKIKNINKIYIAEGQFSKIKNLQF